MRRLLVAAIALFVTLADARAAELTRIWVGFPPGQATDSWRACSLKSSDPRSARP